VHHTGVSRFIGRANLRKRLATLDGEPGRSSYHGGVARFEREDETIVVRPPFGLAHEAEYDRVRVGPVLEAVEQDHVVGVLLVRLGGYAVGVFDGERLVASKVGSRFVKNRHKKGGSSSNRFRRRREEQARALADEVAEVAVRVLAPWRERIEFTALGGDRRAVAAALAAADGGLDWLEGRALDRFLDVAEPRRRVLERVPYDLYASELESV
jgi:peptide subunit release factor 1 (eRF1)